MQQSRQVLEWQAEGEVRGELRAYRKLLRSLLEDRFGALPDALLAHITIIEDPDRLQAAARQVYQVQSLEEFQLQWQFGDCQAQRPEMFNERSMQQLQQILEYRKM